MQPRKVTLVLQGTRGIAQPKQRRRVPPARAQPEDLEAAYKELRPPPPLPEPTPRDPAGQQRALTIADLLHSDIGACIAAWLPSAGDVCRLRCTSKIVRATVVEDAFRFLGLFRAGPGESAQSRLHPHQLASLRHMAACESPPGWRFGELRGGILADDPGLGKTVTLMGLILQSVGAMPATPAEFWDMHAIHTGWSALRHNRIAKQQLLPLLNAWAKAEETEASGARAECVAFADGDAPGDAFPTLTSFESVVTRGVTHDPSLAEHARREVRRPSPPHHSSA